MKRVLLIILISISVFQFVTGNEDIKKNEDDLSRLLLLGFHYFETPYPLPQLVLTGPTGKVESLKQYRGEALLIFFLGENDPFNVEIREEIEFLREIYAENAIQFITVSQDQDDFKDFNGSARDSLGVLKYPSYFIIDHNYNLRGSSEGIYPSLISEDFIKIIDRLLLDIESPGIVNTLK